MPATAVRAGVLIAAFILPAHAGAWPGSILDPGDAARRHDEPFPMPAELDDAVRFWTQLFVHHDSRRVVLHDRQQMEIVWQVLELPLDDTDAVDEEASRRLVRKATEELRERLRRLEVEPAPHDEEDRVLLTLAGGVDAARLEGAWTRVRAQRGVADRFRSGLERAREWLPPIQKILAEERVPPEIAALPFVESMFNPKARSSAGAAGLWQLMPATARGLGLKVGREGDERLDVLTSTRAAARMLRKNYEMLGSWPLAITAYNHGPNGVRRAVREVGSTDLIYLIENYEKSTWGFASKNFYAEFLAATRVFAEAEQSFAALTRTESQPEM